MAATRIEQVRGEIEEWRRSRPFRCSPMPAGLWKKAVRLAHEVGVHPVKVALGLSYQSLKKRVSEDSSISARAGRNARTRFVEIKGADLLGAAGSIVEVLDSEGTRLTVRLAAGSEVDLASLVMAFRDRK